MNNVLILDSLRLKTNNFNEGNDSYGKYELKLFAVINRILTIVYLGLIIYSSFILC